MDGWRPSFQIPGSLGVEDAAGRVGEPGKTGLVDLVVHEGATPLGDNEAHVAQHLEVMGDGGLPQRKVRHDVADADRFMALGQQVQDADPGGVRQRLEPGRVDLRFGLLDGGCSGRNAARLGGHHDGGLIKDSRHVTLLACRGVCAIHRQASMDCVRSLSLGSGQISHANEMLSLARLRIPLLAGVVERR